ncbi:MAG: hypothetical protein B5M53_09950 [Candidatus Cloacimonas sp. 4484_209]|nr:MAG: hypothetical protein B5M53_09950 [Candidatus Cloacimonas sp. 4484_209]
MNIRIKFIIINFILIVITVGPLVFFSLKTTEFKVGQGYVPEIEKTLENAVLNTPAGPEKDEAIKALRGYRQMKALRTPLKRELIALRVIIRTMKLEGSLIPLIGCLQRLRKARKN